MKTSPRMACGAAALALFCSVARAHGWHEAGGADGFAAGFTHPFTGIDHLLAMLAVGLWSASASPRPWLAPLAFAGLLVTGALAAGNGLLPAWALGSSEALIATSVLVLGMLVAWRVRLPALAGAGLVGGFALFHGAAHGTEVGAAAAALAGLATATVLLHGAGMLLGYALQRAPDRAGRAVGRLVGGAIALTGLGLAAGVAASAAGALG